MLPRLMRILRETGIFLFALWAGSTALSWWRAPKLNTDTLPVIQATLIDGTPFDSTAYQGKPLMIHFWGTWCPVCKQEAPNIAYIARHYPVLTIAVNSHAPENIRQWLEKNSINYPVLNDPTNRWAHRFKVRVYPTTFIYDRHGKRMFTEVGYSTTAGLMARMKLAE